MKKAIASISFSFIVCTSWAQVLSIKASRTSAMINQVIEVSYEINAASDSAKAPIFKGFEIVKGPSQQRSTSFINGEMSSTTTYVYRLRPIESGLQTIPSLSFYVKGEPITGEALTLEVTGKSLSPEELHKEAVSSLKNGSRTPKGTVRIVYHDNIGYIEECNGFFWGKQRELTQKELKKLRKIADQ